MFCQVAITVENQPLSFWEVVWRSVWVLVIISYNTTIYDLNYRAAGESPSDGSLDWYQHLEVSHMVLNLGCGQTMSSCQSLYSGVEGCKMNLDLFYLSVLVLYSSLLHVNSYTSPQAPWWQISPASGAPGPRRGYHWGVWGTTGAPCLSGEVPGPPF